MMVLIFGQKNLVLRLCKSCKVLQYQHRTSSTNWVHDFNVLMTCASHEGVGVGIFFSTSINVVLLWSVMSKAGGSSSVVKILVAA